MPAESTLEFYDCTWDAARQPWRTSRTDQTTPRHGQSRVLTQRCFHRHAFRLSHIGPWRSGRNTVSGEIPLSAFFGTGVAVSIPKGKWGMAPAEDLKRYPRSGPVIVVVSTGWHRRRQRRYYAYSRASTEKAGGKGVKVIGTDTQALDHPLATAILRSRGAQGGYCRGRYAYEGADRPQRCSTTGREPCHPGDPVAGHLRL